MYINLIHYRYSISAKIFQSSEISRITISIGVLIFVQVKICLASLLFFSKVQKVCNVNIYILNVEMSYNTPGTVGGSGGLERTLAVKS